LHGAIPSAFGFDMHNTGGHNGSGCDKIGMFNNVFRKMRQTGGRRIPARCGKGCLAGPTIDDPSAQKTTEKGNKQGSTPLTKFGHHDMFCFEFIMWDTKNRAKEGKV
jgi:hypothetical protein